MAANKRTKTERENDLKRVAARLLRGASQAELAEELGLAPSQISYDVKAVFQRWRRETSLAIDAHRARELRKLDTIEAELWARLGVAEQSNAVGLLRTLVQCCERRARLLGLDPPQRGDVFAPKPVPEPQVVFYLPENGREHPNGRRVEPDVNSEGSS